MCVSRTTYYVACIESSGTRHLWMFMRISSVRVWPTANAQTQQSHSDYTHIHTCSDHTRSDHTHTYSDHTWEITSFTSAQDAYTQRPRSDHTYTATPHTQRISPISPVTGTALGQVAAITKRRRRERRSEPALTAQPRKGGVGRGGGCWLGVGEPLDLNERGFDDSPPAPEQMCPSVNRVVYTTM